MRRPLRIVVIAIAAAAAVSPVLNAFVDCRAFAAPLGCGQAVSGSLSDGDCNPSAPDDHGDREDWFYFESQLGPTFSPTFTSSFDGLAGLFDFAQDGNEIALDFSEEGFDFFENQEVLFAGRHYIAVFGFDGKRGTYELTLNCDPDPPPPGFAPAGVTFPAGGGTFQIWTRINFVPAKREVACLAETVCFSGAVPGRSEVLLRMTGPRPDGFLQPSIVKFNTTRVEMWIRQAKTGIIHYFESPAGNQDFWETKGQFMKGSGFTP
jgi:hypothetical protein